MARSGSVVGGLFDIEGGCSKSNCSCSFRNKILVMTENQLSCTWCFNQSINHSITLYFSEPIEQTVQKEKKEK